MNALLKKTLLVLVLGISTLGCAPYYGHRYHYRDGYGYPYSYDGDGGRYNRYRHHHDD